MAGTMENLRDRWERITPRERTLVVALGIAVVVGVVFLAGRMVVGGLDAIEARNDKLRESLLAMQAYRARTTHQEAEAPQVEIPDKPVQLGTYLEEAAKPVGIEIPSFRPQAPVKRGEFEERSMRIDMRGLSIDQLSRFLQQVESNPTVVVSRLTIKRNFRDKEQLNVEITVSTFSKVAKQEDGAEAGDEG